MEYGIHLFSGVFLVGMSREEAHSYMECEAQPGDRIVKRVPGGCWFTLDGEKVLRGTSCHTGFDNNSQ